MWEVGVVHFYLLVGVYKCDFATRYSYISETYAYSFIFSGNTDILIYLFWKYRHTDIFVLEIQTYWYICSGQYRHTDIFVLDNTDILIYLFWTIQTYSHFVYRYYKQCSFQQFVYNFPWQFYRHQVGWKAFSFWQTRPVDENLGLFTYKCK